MSQPSPTVILSTAEQLTRMGVGIAVVIILMVALGVLLKYLIQYDKHRQDERAREIVIQKKVVEK